MYSCTYVFTYIYIYIYESVSELENFQNYTCMRIQIFHLRVLNVSSLGWIQIRKLMFVSYGHEGRGSRQRLFVWKEQKVISLMK